MALRIQDTYPNTTPADVNYPYGSAKNETTPGALDGTPLEKAIYDDILGLMQSIVVAAGVVPSNTADTVVAPQYLTSMFNLRYYANADYSVGTKVVGSDGVTYHCTAANGPAGIVQDPVTDSGAAFWVSEDVRQYEKSHPVGTYYHSHVDSSPEDFMGPGVGTYTRMLGRFIVGLSESDPDFDTPGETGGSKSHNHGDTFYVAGHALTIAQMPTHSHKYLKEDTAGSGSQGSSQGSSSYNLVNTENTGDGLPHNHILQGGVSSSTTLPPYIVAYIWQRTA